MRLTANVFFLGMPGMLASPRMFLTDFESFLNRPKMHTFFRGGGKVFFEKNIENYWNCKLKWFIEVIYKKLLKLFFCSCSGTGTFILFHKVDLFLMNLVCIWRSGSGYDKLDLCLMKWIRDGKSGYVIKCILCYRTGSVFEELGLFSTNWVYV